MEFRSTPRMLTVWLAASIVSGLAGVLSSAVSSVSAGGSAVGFSGLVAAIIGGLTSPGRRHFRRYFARGRREHHQSVPRRSLQRRRSGRLACGAIGPAAVRLECPGRTHRADLAWACNKPGGSQGWPSGAPYGVAALVILAAAPFLLGGYALHLAVSGGLMAVGAMALTVISGSAGLPSLGSAAFLAIGAFTSGVLATQLVLGWRRPCL